MIQKPMTSPFKWLAFSVIFYLVFLFATETFAQTRAVPRYMEKLLMGYASEQTGIPHQGTYPKYLYKTPEEINRIYYKEKYDGQQNILALYQSGVMILNKEFDFEKQPEFLVHEFVHHLQHENGLEYDCQQLEELVAYNTQVSFVDEYMEGKGTKPSPLFLALINTCNPRF